MDAEADLDPPDEYDDDDDDDDDQEEDSEILEVIQTLAPNNESLSTPGSTISSSNNSQNLPDNSASSHPSINPGSAGRRKRDVTSVIRAWQGCDVEVCGVGVR